MKEPNSKDFAAELKDKILNLNQPNTIPRG
jgi:hypothetical protein